MLALATLSLAAWTIGACGLCIPASYRKVGGLHFARLGRVQISGCICRPRGAR